MTSRRRFLLRLAASALLLAAVPAAWAGYLQLTGNVHEVEPGQLYRSAQLDAAGFSKLIEEKGIRAVLNLRGEHAGASWYDEEVAAVKAAGVEHFDLRLSADNRPDAATVAQLVELMRTAPKPLLVHCQGGADRSGLASALYEYAVSARPATVAERQLSFRYGHFPWLWSQTGAMDATFREVVAREDAASH